MKPQHTPTPWSLGKEIEVRSLVCEILDGRNMPTGILVESVDRELSTPSAIEDADKNVAFIVRAVNCYEEMLELLKDSSWRMTDKANADYKEKVQKLIAKATSGANPLTGGKSNE